MLQQALQAAANNMQATGQTVQSSLSGQNQNLQQAAQGVVGGNSWLINYDSLSINLEIAALAQAVENGINQLREMGILEMTTEEEARRILQENGGNVEAAINMILQ